MPWMFFSIPLPSFFSFLFFALPCKRTPRFLRPHTQRHGFQNTAVQYSPLDTSSVPLTLLFLMFAPIRQWCHRIWTVSGRQNRFGSRADIFAPSSQRPPTAAHGGFPVASSSRSQARRPRSVLRCLRPRWLCSLALSGSSHRWPLPGCSALPWIPAALLSPF